VCHGPKDSSEREIAANVPPRHNREVLFILAALVAAPLISLLCERAVRRTVEMRVISKR
jgi:hypothetical protein